MNKVINLGDHQGYSCRQCGSVNWVLLRSGKIECSKCQVLLTNAAWCEVKEPVTTDQFQSDVAGYHAALKWLKDNKLDHKIDGELSRDGYSVVRLANELHQQQTTKG